MTKIVKFTDIRIMDIEIYKDENNKFVIKIIYVLKDEDGKQWGERRLNIIQDEMTPTQVSKIEQISTYVYNKVKQKESI